MLTPGQIQTVSVADVKRVAIGDPDVADVSLVSTRQALLKAKKMGTTNLILWESAGERQITVRVVESKPEAVAAEVTTLLRQLHLEQSVHTHIESGKVFLIGQVGSDEELAAIEQLVTTYKDTTVNLVTVTKIPPQPETVPPLVSLSVQVIDVDKSNLEKLGVGWTKSVALTESSMAASSVARQLLRIGETAQRSVLVASLEALVQQNKARLLAEPKLVTASGKEASSFIGVEVPIIKATSIGSAGSTSVNASIEFRQTGVLLKMTPTVRPDGEQIMIHLTAEISGVDTSVGLSIPVGTQTIVVPGFKSREATTEVTAASGETVVIAGLLQAEDSNTMSQVPGLGSMPVVGRLFRSPQTQATQRELIITITPELLMDKGKAADKQLALEQALAVAEVTASVDDPRLRYALQIQEKISKVLRYPQREKELNMEGTVKLRIHLFADGTLGRAMVSESSGIESFDLEAVKAAESQAPYPGFPSQLTERELWLEVPIIFRP